VDCVLRPDGLLDLVTDVFGRHINHQGCFYHMTQASWRKIQQLGLMPLYNKDDDFRLFCGMMDGLAFLPNYNEQYSRKNNIKVFNMKKRDKQNLREDFINYNSN
jgi:hypothetical protein